MTTADEERLANCVDQPVRLRFRGGEVAEVLPLFVLADEREVIYRLLSTSQPERYAGNPPDQVYLTEAPPSAA